ncbi:hypothetical protein RvY_16951 [Ramazzottius varieornatus]|uniref:G-protein coupled receptors family 1 profile domain-containing protein n=1 Tax=Ramazzottius varieornatus TaxID=947166 RepID=A0A1D1W7L3_RAMVA|nr:hypothetical protein RvY_16951 [Ramazzottius varieornatus]
METANPSETMVNDGEAESGDTLLHFSVEPSANSTMADIMHQKGLSPEVLQQIILLAMFMVVAICGNSIVLAHLIQTKGWQRPVTMFVMSLATTDILIALLSMSTELFWEAFGQWIFGNFACKLATYVQCLLFISTASILISMSYDRYEAICKPMVFSRSLARSRRMIVVSWVLAALLAIPQLFIFVQEEVGKRADGTALYSCKSSGYQAEWQRKVYVTWIALLVFIIPMCCVAYCYVNIAIIVWRSSSTFHVAGAEETERTTLRRNNSKRTQKGIDRAKMKAIQLTICILLCYMVCWAPYFSINLLNVWTEYQHKHNVPSFFKVLAKCLAWFSSCANPIIYGGFHLSLRPSLQRLCPKCFGQQQQGHVSYPPSPTFWAARRTPRGTGDAAAAVEGLALPNTNYLSQGMRSASSVQTIHSCISHMELKSLQRTPSRESKRSQNATLSL